MIISPQTRLEVIENIRRAVEDENFSAVVEPNDPVLTTEESKALTDTYIASRSKLSFRTKSFLARRIANMFTRIENRDSEIAGLEKLADIKGGALVTSNHFSPLENCAIRHVALKMGKRRLNVISHDTNLAMGGFLGFLLNYADVIPISKNVHYMQRDFPTVLDELIGSGELVLIYPEGEMWFNYRKPRPVKEGAYYYASRLGAPIISCFVELVDTIKAENEQFNKVKYRIHVLDVLYPDPSRRDMENARIMRQRDCELKAAAYERAYGKKLEYGFENSDIAGWKCER